MLARLAPDVVRANGMEGGHVHGRDGVRASWERQFALVRSEVHPERDEDGRVVVGVHQVVRSAEGGELLADARVVHLFTFAGPVITRFDIAWARPLAVAVTRARRGEPRPGRAGR